MAKAAPRRAPKTSTWILRKRKVAKAATQRGKPCTSERKGCPIQLFFDRGKPYIRLCVERKKPGPIVRVKDPTDALRKAMKICKCWEKKGDMRACAPKRAKIG